MSQSDTTSRMLRKYLFGLLFLVTGAGLLILSDNTDLLVPKACADADKPFYCVILTVSLMDFGLKGIAIFLLVVGAVTIVLFDYVAGLLAEIIRHISNHHRVIINSIHHALDDGILSRHEKNNLIHAIFEKYNGVSNEMSASFARFVTEYFIDHREREGGFWRKSYEHKIEITDYPASNSLAKDYMNWSEKTSYTIKHVKQGKNYRVKAQTSVSHSVPRPFDIIANWEYTVTCGRDEIFSLKTIQQEIVSKLTQDPVFEFSRKLNSSDGEGVREVTVVSTENKISVTLEYDYSLNEDAEEKIIIDESYPEEQRDDYFVLTLVEPTKGFDFSFSVPSSYRIENFLSPNKKLYGVKHRRQMSRKQMKVEFGQDGWLLPGIVNVVEWRRAED